MIKATFKIDMLIDCVKYMYQINIAHMIFFLINPQNCVHQFQFTLFCPKKYLYSYRVLDVIFYIISKNWCIYGS